MTQIRIKMPWQLAYKGEWSNNTAYQPLEYCTYHNAFYVAKIANTGYPPDVAPTQDTSYRQNDQWGLQACYIRPLRDDATANNMGIMQLITYCGMSRYSIAYGWYRLSKTDFFNNSYFKDFFGDITKGY